MTEDSAHCTDWHSPGLDQMEMKAKKTIQSCVALHLDESALSKYSPIQCDAHDNTDCVLDTLFSFIVDWEVPECLLEDLNFVLRDEHKLKLETRLTKTLPQLQSAKDWEACWNLVIKLTDSDLEDKFEQEIDERWRTYTKGCLVADSLCMFTKAVQCNCDNKHTVAQLSRCLNNYLQFMSEKCSSLTDLDWTPVIKNVRLLASVLRLRKRLRNYSDCLGALISSMEAGQNPNSKKKADKPDDPKYKCGICSAVGKHFSVRCPERNNFEYSQELPAIPVASTPPDDSVVTTVRIGIGNALCCSCGQSESGHTRWECPGNGVFCSACNLYGHTPDRCPQQIQPLSDKEVECFNCNQMGHINKDCPMRSRDGLLKPAFTSLTPFNIAAEPFVPRIGGLPMVAHYPSIATAGAHLYNSDLIPLFGTNPSATVRPQPEEQKDKLELESLTHQKISSKSKRIANLERELRIRNAQKIKVEAQLKEAKTQLQKLKDWANGRLEESNKVAGVKNRLILCQESELKITKAQNEKLKEKKTHLEKERESFNILIRKFNQQLEEAKQSEMKMLRSLTEKIDHKNGLIEWLKNEVKRLGEKETQMETERDRSKCEQAKMVEQLEKELKSERGRTSSLEANAGVWESENNRLLETMKQYEAQIRKLQQELQTVSEKNASRSEKQRATNKAHTEDLETAANSQELATMDIQNDSQVVLCKLREVWSTAEHNVQLCESKIVGILGKQPVDRAQLDEWQREKFNWENARTDIETIINSQELTRSPVAIFQNPQVQNVAKSSSSAEVQANPSVQHEPVKNGPKHDMIGKILSGLKARSLPNLTRQMVETELLALRERNGGKMNARMNETIEQLYQVFAPRDNECVICHEEMGAKNLTQCSVCQHKYHNKCANQWLKRHKNCPMCRSMLSPQ